MQMIPSADVACFRDIRTQWRKQLALGFFYAEGEQVFSALLRTAIEIESVLITPDCLDKHRGAMENRLHKVFVADKGAIEKNAQIKLNQGVVALARIPQPPTFNDLLSPEKLCIVALNGINHAVNVGSILRNCAAFGVAGVFVDSNTVHPYCYRSLRTSLGGTFRVPVYATSDLCADLKRMQNSGFRLIAADPSGESRLSQMTSRRLCVIFGNEHEGLSKSVLTLGPARVGISMRNVDSLNVAATSAIFLHDILSNRL